MTPILFIHIRITLKFISLDNLQSCFCLFVLLFYDYILIDFTSI